MVRLETSWGRRFQLCRVSGWSLKWEGRPRPSQDRPSHGQRSERPLTKPLSAKVKITDSAPRGSSPTSLLNHETSDHLLSRLKARTAVSPGTEARVHRWPCACFESSRRGKQVLYSWFSASKSSLRAAALSAALCLPAILDHAGHFGPCRDEQGRLPLRLHGEAALGERHRVENRVARLERDRKPGQLGYHGLGGQPAGIGIGEDGIRHRPAPPAILR